MNWYRIASNFRQLHGVTAMQTKNSTNADLNYDTAFSDQVVRRVQERYAISKDDAERQIDHWRMRGFDPTRSLSIID